MRISDWSSDVCSSDLLDIGMIGGLAQHPRDDATLFGHSQALLVAKGFDIDHMSHERNLGTVADKSKPPPHISSAARQVSLSQPLFPPRSALCTQTNFLGERAALRRIIGSDHRIVAWKSPFGTILEIGRAHI